MKTQVALNSFQDVLARDSLKKISPQRFTMLYDLLLFAAVPIAFELSYVKVLQRSLHAYQTSDWEAICRLIAYLTIQGFLGLLVNKNYLKVTLKGITLSILILLQHKEAFFEEVLFDMMISMVLKSGWMMLMFIKLSYLLIFLKLVVVYWLIQYLFLMGVHKVNVPHTLYVRMQGLKRLQASIYNMRYCWQIKNHICCQNY
jgi:hypothetical protein